MRVAALHISGDKSIASFEDNLQDIHLAAVQAVEGFYNQGTNGSVDDFLKTEGFNKYIKSCIWNAKHKKGSRIKDRYPINNNSVSLSEHDDILNIPGPCNVGQDIDEIVMFFSAGLNEQEGRMLELLHKRPSLLKKNGTINMTAIADAMGIRHDEAGRIYRSMQRKMQIQREYAE